jgi:hypothetical protein
MYDSASAVWMGLAKNATEGIATPARIAPFTLLLLLGQVLPLLLFAIWLVVLSIAATRAGMSGTPLSTPWAAWMTALLATALVASYVPRLLAVRRFKQPMMAAVLHPVGVVLLLCVQWYALGRQVSGRPVAWRARRYSSETGEEVS